MTARRTRSMIGEAIALAVIYAAVMALCLALRLGPDPVLVAAALLLGHAVLRLLFGIFAEPGNTWAVEGAYVEPDPGRDTAFADVLRVLEDHLTARVPNAGLQTRLAHAADDALLRHHRTTRSDPSSVGLLGPDLHAALAGPPRRLTPDEIDDFVRRIEAL